MFTPLFNNPLINSHCLQNELQAHQGPSTFQSDQTAPSSSVTSRSLSDRRIINYSFFWATMAFNDILKSPLTQFTNTNIAILKCTLSGFQYIHRGASSGQRVFRVLVPPSRCQCSWPITYRRVDGPHLVHHSSDVTHLGCLHFLAVMSTAITVFVWTRFLFPWAYTWSRIARHIWLFLCKLLSCTIYIVTFIGGNRQGMWTHRQNRSKNPDFSTAPH